MNEDKSHCHDFKPKDGTETAFTIRTAPGQRVDDNYIKESNVVTITTRVDQCNHYWVTVEE